MIYLYDSTATDFRYHGKPLPLAYQVPVRFTINGEFYVTGRYPLDNKGIYKEITEDKIVKVHTPDGMEPFRIVNVVKYDTYIEFEAWPLFYADMRNKLVKPLNLRNATGQVAVNQFVNNLLIDTPFKFYSNIQDTHDYRMQDEDERENNPNQFYDALEVFSDIVRRWNGEVRIRGYDIRINDSIGIDTEKMLYERKNIVNFVDSTNIEGIVTRVHGKSEWTEEAQEGEEEGQKRSIQVTVDSPLINEYSGIIFEKQYTNNDLRTEKELEDWLKLKFSTENIDKPSHTIEVGTNVIGNSGINAGDTLILKYVMHDVDVRIKAVGYEYDGMDNEYINFVLGEPKTSSTSTIGNSITDLVDNIVRPVERKALEARASANSKNTNFYGKEEPTGTGIQTGDLWYKTVGNGERELYRFTGTVWNLEKVSAGLLAGTLDAQNGDVDLINVNVANIVGETSEFVQSNWNSATGGSVRATGDGIVSHATNGAQAYMQNGVFGTRQPDGAGIGYIGYDQDGSRPFYTITQAWGANFRIRSHHGDGIFRSDFEIYAGSNETYLRTAQTRIMGDLYVEGNTQLRNALYMNNKNISDVNRITLTRGGTIEAQTSNSNMRLESANNLTFHTRHSQAFLVDGTHTYMYRTLSMEGNNITNQSDERLKTNIFDHKESSLDKINQFNFVDFEWAKDGREDFGVIAQQVQQVAPELIEEDSNGILSLNNSLLNMMTTHALQELSYREANTNILASENRTLIEELQEENKQLKCRVKELERKVEEKA